MDIAISLSLIVAIVGLIIYFGVDNKPKKEEVGHIMFWVGLFVFLLRWGGTFALTR